MSVREFQDALLARNLVARIADTDPVDAGEPEAAPEGLSTGPTSLATPTEQASAEPTIALASKRACGGACNPPMDPTVQEFSDAVMAERIASTIKSV